MNEESHEVTPIGLPQFLSELKNGLKQHPYGYVTRESDLQRDLVAMMNKPDAGRFKGMKLEDAIQDLGFYNVARDYFRTIYSQS